MQFSSIIIGACAIAIGAARLLKPSQTRATHGDRLAALQAGAKEDYFEEQRTLEAYPPPSTDTKQRAYGMLGIVLGLGTILFGVLN